MSQEPKKKKLFRYIVFPKNKTITTYLMSALHWFF